jgi:uncharacterized protein YbjT (DUF2867 family)
MDVVVAGATGQQGGAVVDHLLDGNHGDFEVYALSRSPESDACQVLEERGATTVGSDLSDKETFRSTVENADGVFCVTSFAHAGTDGEIEHGTNMAEVAADVGIEHFVFSSVGGAERDSGVPHFESKYQVEQRISELDLPATIIRPAAFMQNFEGQREAILDGTLAGPLEEGVSLQRVDVDSVGALTAEAFADPERYRDEAIELASDEHTLEEAAAVFSEVTGVDVEAEHLSPEVARGQIGEEYTIMYEWFNEHGYGADIKALRREHDIEFTSLDENLRKQGWPQ